MSAAPAEHRPANGSAITPPPDESAGDQHPSSSRFTAVNGRSPPSGSEDSKPRQPSASTSSHPSEDSALNPKSRDTTHHHHHHHHHHHPHQQQQQQQQHHHHHSMQQRDSQPPLPPPPSTTQRRDSHSSSTGKRKHGSSGGESPASVTSQQSQKKRRGTTPSERPRPMGNGASDYTGQDPAASAAYAAHHRGGGGGGPNEHADERAWQQGHHRDGSSISDTHLAEALQRESQQLGPHQISSATASPEQRYPDISTPSQPSSSLNPLAPGQSSTTSNPMSAAKPRKRNFSNRTKTGCMTCRERKKKCDEGKPICKNCERGGFLCKGYNQTSHYKHGVIRDAPPIQAKNGYYEQVGPYPYQNVPPRPEYYDTHASHPHPPPPPPSSAVAAAAAAAASRPPPPPPLPPSAADAAVSHRPMSGEEERPHVSTMFNSPDDESSRSAYRRYRQWTPEHHPGPYAAPPPPPESIPPPYGEMLPMATNSSRQQHKKLPPPTAVLNHPSSHHQRSPSQPGHYSSTQMAQLALDASRGGGPVPPHAVPPPPLPPSSHAPPVYRPSMEEQFRTEKERMLNGLPYKHRDPQLKKERQECAIAVHRFNKNAVDPTNLSESSRREQFRQILEPPTASQAAANDSDAATSTNGTSSASSGGSGAGAGAGGAGGKSSSNGNNTNNNNTSNSSSAGQHHQHQHQQHHRTGSPDALTAPVGHVGANVEVEAPFYCDYGYNIRIEEEVDIGPNCRIIDSCPVHIGARTIIGPDVRIITTDGCHAMKRPPGSKRLMIGKKVVIGEDCFIGAGAVIMPGVTIGDRAVVGAHTIVLKNVQGPHTLVNHHHTRLLRSDYNNGPPHRY